MPRKNSNARKNYSRPKESHYRRKQADDLNEALFNNGKAIIEGAQKKKWTKHDLKNIRALTVPQGDMIQAYLNNYDVCAYGSSGTGKP